jgi:hypothetical protein
MGEARPAWKKKTLDAERRGSMNVNDLFVAFSNIVKDCVADKQNITAEEWKQIGERFMTLALMNRKVTEDKEHGNTSDRSNPLTES